MDLQFEGVEALRAELTAEIAKLRADGVAATRQAARVLQAELFARTPVWEGETIRNYAWGFNSSPGGGHRAPVGGGEPGTTGSMGLGEEPNRAANEAAVEAELDGVLSGVTTLGTLTVGNFGDIWDLVDNGSAPTADRARNPGGVSMLAEQAARSSLPNFK